MTSTRIREVSPVMQVNLISCKIERGGFTSERTFTIATTKGLLTGTAFIEHLFDTNQERLADDIPPQGVTIDGFVQCRVIQRVNGQSLIEVPSGDVVQVPAEMVVSKS